MTESEAGAAHIPARLLDLLEGEALAHIATLRPDGTPHIAPVWIDHDGDDLLVNTRVDRLRAGYMRDRRAVAVSIVDPHNPYRFLTVRGLITSWTEEGWQEHMNSLARRYMRLDSYPWFFEGERRAIFRIKPLHVYFEEGEIP